jgi:YHS domain-containing protein
MKKMNQYLLLAACALGVAVVSVKAGTTDASATGCTMGSCCGGATLTAVSDTDTNAVPDNLKTCPVSGEKLGGDMGEPYRFVYQGQEVKLCCKSCKKDFDKNPDKYLKKIRAADKK